MNIQLFLVLHSTVFCSRHSRAFFVPGFLKCRHARLSAQTDGGRVIKSTYERRWTNLRPSWRASWKGEKKPPRRAKSSSFREHFCFISTPHSFFLHLDNAFLKWSGKSVWDRIFIADGSGGNKAFLHREREHFKNFAQRVHLKSRGHLKWIEFVSHEKEREFWKLVGQIQIFWDATWLFCAGKIKISTLVPSLARTC